MRLLTEAARSVPGSVLALRALVLLLPLASLLIALPTVPHPWLLGFVALASTGWAWRPEDVAGPIVLVSVVAWWGVHGDDGPRLLAVAGCLLGAHVAAVLSGYGPASLPVDRRVVRRWLGRAVLTGVPVPVTYLAVHALEADTAPGWLWTAAVGVVLVLTLVATGATRVGERRG